MTSIIHLAASRPKFFRSVLLVVAAALITVSCAATGPRELERATVEFLAPNVSVSEERLVSVEQAHPGTFRFCRGSEGDRYAFARQYGEVWSVVLDGKEGQKFEQLSETANLFIPHRLYPGFSKDCARFAYAGRRNGFWHLVVNEEIKPSSYDTEPISVLKSLDEITPRYSEFNTPPQNVHIVEENRERYVVVDGKELKHYSVGAKGGWFDKSLSFLCGAAMTDCSFHGYGPMGPIYRDDARQRIGYQVDHKRGLFYVIDEVEYGPYDSYLGRIYAGDIIFSPDGKHFAFQAMRDGKGILNVNGVDTLSMPVLRYREPGVLVRNEMMFPYKFLESNRLQTYAIKNKVLVRLIIDIAE
jgi:hypothetical protein